MVERRRIVELWQHTQATVLITLVRVEGSSYRRTGARVLVGADSASRAGTISGGCLETEVVRRAHWLTRDGASVERYSMLFDDTAEIPFGLGCGGVVGLLFEPVNTAEAEALRAAMKASLEGRESTVVTFLPDGDRPLRRAVFAEDGGVTFQSAGLSEAKLACAQGLEPGGTYEGRFVERLQPPQRLVLLGAGDDAVPVAALAAQMGWSVVVADGRAQLARAERFPTAEQVLTLGQGADGLGLRATDAVVLMSHSYEQDRENLVAALAAGPRFIGMLGSRQRSSLLLAEAAERLERTLADCCRTVYAPVGLNIGGDEPEAVALSIVAQVQATQQGRAGASQRLDADEVERLIEGGRSAERYLQRQCALDAAETADVS